MKKKIFILALAGALSGSVFTACNSPEKRVENAAENVADAREDLAKAEQEFAEEWEKFRMESEMQIQNNDNEIAEYRDMETKDKTWGNKNRERIDELEAKNKALKDKINNYDAEKRRDNWESFKAEFKHDMDELGAALKDFGRDNKK